MVNSDTADSMTAPTPSGCRFLDRVSGADLKRSRSLGDKPKLRRRRTAEAATLSVLSILPIVSACTAGGVPSRDVAPQVAPLRSSDQTGYGSELAAANKSFDVALNGFSNTTSSPIRVVADSTKSVGMVVKGVYLEMVPNTNGQPQTGFGPTPLRWYRTYQPVRTNPVASVVPPGRWKEFLVRVALAPGRRAGAIYSVTLTYLVSGASLTTVYKVPYVLCASQSELACASLASGLLKQELG